MKIPLRLLLYYNRQIIMYNLPVSLLGGFAGSIQGSFPITFALTYVSAGFVVSVYFYEKMSGRQYYYFQNRSLSRPFLIGSAFISSLTIALITLAIYTISAGT